MKPSCLVSLLAVAACASMGCATNRYAAPVGDFRDRAQATIGVLSEFYDSRNDYELQVYLNSVAANSQTKLVEVSAQGVHTPLGKPVFSPAGIKARLDALDLIGAYANRLADLASSTAPAKFHDTADLLGTNLSSLDQTFKTLGGKKDPTANAYIMPITDLIGAIGQTILEHKRDVMIKEAVDKAEGPINKILEIVKSDLDNIFSLASSTGESDNLSDLVKAYNSDAPNISFDQRQARLKQIEAAVKGRSVAAASVPSSLVTSLAEAHHALVRLARSSRKPQDFAAFNDALAAWTSRIQSAAAQLKILVM